MGVIADTFAAMLEELKQRDNELNRDIQDTIKRCNTLLDKLSKLDDE
jgi:flagellar hook-associated protein FlgK